MKAVFLRNFSAPIRSSMVPGSPKISFSCTVQDSVNAALLFGENQLSPSPWSLHLQMKGESSRSIRRAKSESNRSFSLRKHPVSFSMLTFGGYRSFPAMIPEEEEELDFVDGGAGKGKKLGGGNSGACAGGGFATGGSADQSKIDAYYQKMLKANPGDPLLLRNYGQFLHQVERNAVRAEDYYGRAILAGHGDGAVLSLYGKLIWETHRDKARAKSYFEQAVQASPDDCFVMGSYAHFLWNADEDEEEGGKIGAAAAALVEAF